MAEPTTTSYVILALLAVQPWNTYELAQQMRRSVNWFWPTAESVVYEEPKRLVANGFANVRKEYTGRRRRTVYSITPKGRRALRTWLRSPGAGPALHFESLLQVSFADLGTRDDLIRTMRSIREDAQERLDQALAQCDDYVHTGGPFPERLHVIALGARFALAYSALLVEWAEWAERSVERWPDVRSEVGIKPPDGAFSPPQLRRGKRSTAV
jgi:DNA-binding PadR family transcriptional regulator